jgi:phospholipid/cholesterol/gamma-HCH transport system substrate-binding protein
VRSKLNLPLFLGYAACSLAVLVYLVVQMGGEFFLQPSYQVRVEFVTASDLVPGDDVTISGLRVGKVDSIRPVQGGAEAFLVLHQQYAPLYQDARAMIKTKNLLGEAYVEINRGTGQAGPLPQGGRIERANTLTPVEVDQVLSVLDQDTRQQLVSLIDNLGQSVSGRGQDLNSEAASLKQVAQSLQTVAHSVASQQQNLDTLLTALQKVLDTLAAWHSELRLLIGNWDRLMRTLASREQDLQGLFVNEDQVMAVLDQALSHNAPALHQTIAQSPQLIDNAQHYTTNGTQIFGQIASNTTSITDLFYELASVMSATDSQGNHYWRVYPVSGGLGTIGQPLIPPPAQPQGGGG